MLYQEFQPCKPLQSFISKFYHIFYNGNPEAIPPFLVPASGLAYVNFNFKSKWTTLSDNQPQIKNRITLNGQVCEKNIYVKVNGHLDSIGIEFYLLEMSSLFNIPLEKTTNHTEILDYVIEEDLDPVYEKALQKDSIQGKIKVIEEWLLQKVIEKRTLPPYLRVCQKMIDQSHGHIPIINIAKEVKYSKRTLEKNFRYYTGIPLKYYAQIKRINNVIRLSKKMPEIDWNDLHLQAIAIF